MKIRKEFIVGIVAAIGIVGLIIGFFFLKGDEFWKESDTYYALFPRVDGLTEGNNVYYKGKNVGKVKGVEINPKDINTMVVKFDISDKKVKIPLKSVAKLEADLLGTASLMLVYYDTTEYHVNGDTLGTEVAEDLATEIKDRFDPLMLAIDDLIGTADSAITTIEVIFSNNTGNLNESFTMLNQAMTKFVSVADNMDSLITTLSANRYQFTNLINNMVSITGSLKESNDNIKKIAENTVEITDSLKNLQLASTINKAAFAIDQVNLILDEIRYGDGTLTQLMQDSLLYDNMNLMVDEATRLVQNIKDHPNRYLQFAVFGSKNKGMKLDSRAEKALKNWVNDTLIDYYKKPN